MRFIAGNKWVGILYMPHTNSQTRDIPYKHFKDEYPQCPPIHFFAMASSLDDLWSQILRSTTQCECASKWTVVAAAYLQKVQV